MVESVFFKPVSLSLAIVTLIESFIWSVLSLLSILCYSDIIKYDPNDNSMDYGLNVFTATLYNLYLSGNPAVPNENRVVIPGTFNILMWLYFILSLLLLFSSGVQISVLCTNSKPRKTNFSTYVWLTLIYTVCVFDLITCILFSLDYHFIKDYIKIDIAQTEILLAVTITLLILAAKGFVLWIFNLTLAIIVSVIFRTKVKNETLLQVVNPKMYARNNAAYDAYGDVTLDPQIDPPNSQIKEADQPQLNKWNSEPDEESTSSLGSFFNDDVVTVSNTFPRSPRVHTDSYEIPRSLVSTNTSPVPAPSLPSTHFYNEPDNDNKERRRSVYENDDDDDDVLSSQSYLSSAFPHPRRFTLHEPAPDY